MTEEESRPRRSDARAPRAKRRVPRASRPSARIRRSPGGNGSRRRSVVALAVLVGIALLVVVPVYGAWRVLMTPTTSVDVTPGEPVQVEIPAGAGTAAIAGILADAGVIENAALFRLRARLDEIDAKLRPGLYEFETGMSYEAVIDKLLTGVPVPFVTVTIPEGYTVKQIVERLAEEADIPAEEFAAAAADARSFAADHPYLAEVPSNTLEGYLFPKTYRIVEGSSARDVAELMLDQFDAEVEGVSLKVPEDSGLSFHEFVTIASMVEREAQLDKERPLVSSVIYNRLDQGMKLEICATIEYILPGSRPRLLNEHLKIDSPYNTYIYAGLPPGPIASPGLASLQAAAAPAKTDYIFYVLTGEDGSHTFTKSYSEFLRAKEKSRDVVP